MWQVLVAAAVAGSGFVARNIFNSADVPAESVPQHSDQQLVDHSASLEKEHSSQQTEFDAVELCNSIPSLPDQNDVLSLKVCGADTIFRFSSSGSKCKKSKVNGNQITGKKKTKKKKRGVDVQKVERRFTLRLKRRKTGKSASVDSSGCWYNGNANSLFGCGVGVGIMYMMSSGKAEISKLNATMDQTVKAVGELKNELCKRKASCISKSPCPSDKNTYEGDEYPSSILTEEPEPQHVVQEMDQLEADLEFELSKLTSCDTEASFDQGIGSALYQTEVLENVGQQMCNSFQFNGVEPSVLDKKLSQLLIQQQESQINELEYELQSANSKLQQKEAELRALKDCVRRLSSFSLSNISGNETETPAEDMVED